MSSERDPLSRYLDRLKAASRSDELKEYSERLLWTTRCRQLLEELRSEGFDFTEELQVPSLKTEGVASIPRPDFTISRDELRLFVFIDTQMEQGIILTQSLRSYHRALVHSPLTSGVIHSWRGPDMPSVSYDLYSISKLDLTDRTVRVPTGLPLKECIRDFYSRSFVGDWELESLNLRREKSKQDTFTLVETHLKRELQTFKARALRRWDRKEAQSIIDEKVLLGLLREFRRAPSADRRDSARKLIERSLEGKG